MMKVLDSGTTTSSSDLSPLPMPQHLFASLRAARMQVVSFCQVLCLAMMVLPVLPLDTEKEKS